MYFASWSLWLGVTKDSMPFWPEIHKKESRNFMLKTCVTWQFCLWFPLRDVPETYPHSGQNIALLAIWSSTFHEWILLCTFKVSMWFFLLTLETFILISGLLEYWNKIYLNKIVVDTTTSKSKLGRFVSQLSIYLFKWR